MTAVAKKMQSSWAQSYAEWVVLLVVAVALVAGWGLKAYAENRTKLYSADGLTVSYPANWMPSKAADGSLRFRNTQAGAAPATITVRPALGAADAAKAIATEADALSLTRSQTWTAYRTLSTDAKATFRGQPARRISYVFVQDNTNAFQQSLPTVMLGEDLLTFQQGRVYVLSLQAPQDEFGRAQRYFEALLGSATFGSK